MPMDGRADCLFPTQSAFPPSMAVYPEYCREQYQGWWTFRLHSDYVSRIFLTGPPFPRLSTLLLRSTPTFYFRGRQQLSHKLNTTIF